MCGAATFCCKARGASIVTLLETDTGHVLIDTGFHSRRAELVKELEAAGCRPGDPQAHRDHARRPGSHGQLRFSPGPIRCAVAVHRDESPAVASANMGVNRASRQNPVSRALLSLFSWFSRSDRFKPDCHIEEGNDLAAYGFHARVLHLPGHSKGSIGILTGGRRSVLRGLALEPRAAGNELDA